VVSEEETKVNVAFGYLSVLLGFLCFNKSIDRHVRTRLADGTLRHLIISVEDFLNYHKMAEEIQDCEENVSVKTVFVNRLEGVVAKLRALEMK
jgi:hypothetical protein